MTTPTTAELRVMLRKRCPTGQWALFEEVHDQAGFNRSRSCDAIAMNLWPSKGLELHGFEIKTSRADWLNELRDPDKSETFRQFCDRWWLVIGDRKIVQDDLPEGWGLLWPRGDKLVTSRGAVKLEPKPPDRDFLAVLLRHASKNKLSGTERKVAYDCGYTRGQQSGTWQNTTAKEKYQELKTAVRVFQERSGVQINHWDGPKLGDAVAVVLKLQARFGPLKQLRLQKDCLIKTATELADGAEALLAVCQTLGLALKDDK